jgi:hypothetical protein
MRRGRERKGEREGHEYQGHGIKKVNGKGLTRNLLDLLYPIIPMRLSFHQRRPIRTPKHQRSIEGLTHQLVHPNAFP